MIAPDADARSEDEPVCYSQACKKALDEPDEEKIESDERNIEDYQIALNDEIKALKEAMKETELLIKELSDGMGEYELEMLSTENDVDPFKNKLQSFKHTVDTAKKAYKHAFDSATTPEDYDEAKLLRDDYDRLVEEYEAMMQEYDDVKLKAVETEDLFWDKRSELQDARDLLKAQIEEFDNLRFDFRMSQKNSQFIVIQLSRTCDVLNKMMYENENFEYSGDCLKYRDIMHLDNTDQRVSGKIYDAGWDLQREKPGYKDHWRYYEQVPSWKVITVIPGDATLLNKATIITVQPNPVTYLTPPGAKDPTSVQGSFNQTINERYVWHDIYIDRYCQNVSVSPDVQILERAVAQVMSDCKDPYENYITKKTYRIWEDFRVIMPSWMNNIVDKFVDKVEEVVPKEDPDAVVCYSQMCKSAMDKKGIPWKDP